mmetsp:Transcript_25208/g.33557  ORF Transcript_25208/g.33557 Transcript_25208/m.33557 type:complete len:85 (-) Transcript_25208:698-952(-)
MIHPRINSGHRPILLAICIATICLSLVDQTNGFLSVSSRSSKPSLAAITKTSLGMGAYKQEECPEIPTSPQLLPSGDVAVLALG